MQAFHLRTEYIKNPIGVDFAHPRLFWNCEGGIAQTAYRIVAESGGATVWDSGKVESNRMTGIVYPNVLVSRQQVTWQVMLWDENGEAGAWSEPACFEMGLLQPSDWRAKWIAGHYRVKKQKRYPVDCFRKEINLPNGTCRHVTAGDYVILCESEN